MEQDSHIPYGQLTDNWFDNSFNVAVSGGDAYYWTGEVKEFSQNNYYGYTPAEIRDFVGQNRFWSPGTEDYSVDLWGPQRTHEDIAQGVIGDCYALAGFAVAAHHSNKSEKTDDTELIVKKVLPLTGDSSKNIYPFTFFQQGMPQRFFVDGSLVVKDDSTKRTIFSHLGKDGSYWVTLFEKAWAKYNGNYNHIVGGAPGEVLAAMTGAPYETKMRYYSGQRYSNHYDGFDEIWSGIKAGLDA